MGKFIKRLVNGYRKVKGKDPSGLDLIKIKLEAAEQIRNSEKIIKFPEEKITPFYEERPSKGPQADVKKFPTKNKPAAQTYSSDFLDLLEEFNKISKNQPSLAEITGVSNKYPEKTGIVKSTIELLESKDPKSLSRELQRIMKREGTYVDYSDEEVAQILNGFESRTKNKIKPAEEIINEGDFDPSGFAGGGLAYMLGEPVRMFKGGRIGYSVGAGKKGVQGLLDLVKNKFGKESITTADKVARPEKAITKEMFDAFNKRLKEKTKSYKQGDPITSENFGDTSFAPDMTGLNKAREMDDDIVKFRTENPAGKGRFTKAEVIITRLKNTIQGAKNNPDETSDYVLKNFPNMIEELKNKPELANNENVFQTLAVEGLPKNQRLKVYDDGTVDFQTLKPTHQFKLKEDIKRKLNAEGGRIGFAAGGIDKVRRAFLKLLGAGAGATAATKTGLFGLLKGKQEAKIATKAAEQVVQRNEPPAYVFDLVEIIRAKGKDITKSAQTIERETVKTYKGVDLYETPDGFRIRAEGKSAQEGGKEIDLMYSQMDEIKDEGLETQKTFTVTDYEEATVRPDAEGKMKDVDFYVDEADHKELQKIVDGEKNKFKSGGLAYMLGE
jgi:hypothetical protein